jgi:hypothetical protein
MCRLIISQVSGEPSIVEVINFAAFSSGTYIYINVCQITNPGPNVVNAVIGMSLFTQVSGSISYVHRD